ncbi:MAG: hypothetical protein ABI460_22045 [Caldimonas sp.]
MTRPRITISPLQWSRLQDLRDVAPLDAADVACMDELRHVLARHDRLGRFALHLVHKHFDVASHEVLVEYSDPLAREQFLRVETRDSEALRDAVPTTWTLHTGKAVVVCVCASRVEEGHLGRHESA